MNSHKCILVDIEIIQRIYIMYKKFRWGKTTQVYVPIAFSEEVKGLIRAIDDTRHPKATIESLTELIDKLRILDKYD